MARRNDEVRGAKVTVNHAYGTCSGQGLDNLTRQMQSASQLQRGSADQYLFQSKAENTFMDDERIPFFLTKVEKADDIRRDDFPQQSGRSTKRVGEILFLS